eukprot:419335-Rhodomonas_salina.5
MMKVFQVQVYPKSYKSTRNHAALPEIIHKSSRNHTNLPEGTQISSKSDTGIRDLRNIRPEKTEFRSTDTHVAYGALEHLCTVPCAARYSSWAELLWLTVSCYALYARVVLRAARY